jgi:NAD kinase
MLPDVSNLTIVRRETRLQGLKAKWGTVGQARFMLRAAREQQAEQVAPTMAKRLRAKQKSTVLEQADFDDYQHEDEQYQDVIDRLERELDFGLPIKVLDRSYVPNYDFSRTAVVIVVGQDGLVANTAKYVGELPIVAVNPDPQRFDGLLLPFKVEQVRGAVQRVLDEKFRARPVTLAEVTLGDQQRLIAFNDFFIGTKSHVSARYLLTVNERVEPQSSSGILVATGAGSTGWLSSVFNMAAGVAEFLGTQLARPQPWAWEERQLGWAVREPFLSKQTQVKLVAGKIHGEQALLIESLMPENGVIFSDGIEADYLPFNSGTIARIGIAPQQAQIVVG